MSLEKQDYLNRIARSIQDIGEFIEPDDVFSFLLQAVLLYSKDRPRVIIHEITGDGSSFDFAMPSGWVEEFSYIKTPIEYPVNDTIQQRSYLESNDWMLIRKLVSSETVLYLRFLTVIPASSVKARFEYTAQHTLNDSTNTIKDGDSNAVIALATSLCFWALAARFAQSSDPTINADVIDYQRKSDVYTELAKQKLSEYRTLLGIGQEGKGSAPASAGVAIKDLDISYPGSIGEYLTHPSNIR